MEPPVSFFFRQRGEGKRARGGGSFVLFQRGEVVPRGTKKRGRDSEGLSLGKVLGFDTIESHCCFLGSRFLVTLFAKVIHPFCNPIINILNANMLVGDHDSSSF